MTTIVLPDTEAIAVGYLLTRTEVTGLIGGPPASSARIGSTLDLTGAAALPALRVTRVSTTSPVRRHLRAANVQLEAFAETPIEAQDLLETAVAVLHEDGAGSIIGTHPGLGVVDGVDEAIGPRPQPDPETDTPRWLGSVIIYAHPIPPPP
jgi:hypothetical protein